MTLTRPTQDWLANLPSETGMGAATMTVDAAIVRDEQSGSRPAASLPTSSQRFAPYEVESVLGRGGMGVVYRARHIPSGELVALKTVFAHDEFHIAGIRREVHALQQTRHPGVVQILGFGIAGSQPFYAMQLLAGRTLRDELRHRDKQQRVQGLVQTVEWMHRLAATLAFLHGSGIVHRDLKPDNVFLGEDDVPILVDFGIASRVGGATGRDVIESNRSVVGSIGYMSPEQLLGQPVDARADLYSFGCVLFELLTGRPPFSTAAGHLQEPPRSPSALGAEVPRELDDLVLGLLQKRREDRIGYASDVEAALLDLGATPLTDWPIARPYLYSPALCGRASVLTQLSTPLYELAKGRGGFILIGGESGVGKTRVANEWVSVAGSLGLKVVAADCAPVGYSSGRLPPAPLEPLRPWLAHLADTCSGLSSSPLLNLMQERGAILAPYSPELANLGLVTQKEPPPQLPAEAARLRLLHAIRDALFASSSVAPLVLLLDDAQWADELTLGVLNQLARADLAGQNLLVLATYRADQASTPEIEALVGLSRGDAASQTTLHVELPRLDASSIRSLVGSMLGRRQPSDEFVEAIVRQSNGNPFFAGEYVRTAIATGLLSRAANGFEFAAEHDDAVALSFPSTLRDLMQTRLENLGNALEVLQAAAVLGSEFELPTIAALHAEGQQSGDVLNDQLRRLRFRQILEEPSVGTLRFVHEHLREAAYATIAPARAVALHHHAALLLESLTKDSGRELQWTTLAEHWSRANVPESAASYFENAARRTRAAFAHRDAIALWSRAVRELRLIPENHSGKLPRLGTALEELGDLQKLVGAQNDARVSYDESFQIATHSVERGRLLRKIGKCFETRQQFAEAVETYALAERALGVGESESPSGPSEAAVDPRAWWQEWFRIQTERVFVGYWLASNEDMAPLVRKVRETLDTHGVPEDRLHFLKAAVLLQFRRERFVLSVETIATTRAAQTAALSLGDPTEILETTFMVGFAQLFGGLLSEAEATFSELLGELERAGDLILKLRTLTYLMLAQRWQGKLGETSTSADRCAQLATELVMHEYVGAAQANRAWIALRRGQVEEAARLGHNALQSWACQSLVYPLQWMAHWPLLELANQRGEFQGVQQHARAMLDPKQQSLPEELAEQLRALVDPSIAEPEAAQLAARALKHASARGYV